MKTRPISTFCLLQEHHLVEQSLVRLLSQDPPGTLNSIFQQILISAAAENEESDEHREVLREAAIKFLAVQLRRLPEEALKPELEELIVTQVKKVSRKSTSYNL